MNIASIDIGTNTVLLLIASLNDNGAIKPLLNVYRVPRIGKNVSNGTPIHDEKINELIQILNEYKTLIDKYDCTQVFAYATNALRIASNSQFVINKVKQEIGIDIEVISGSDEAKYGFMGAVSGIQETNDLEVIDIGGGSTEIIIGDKFGNYAFKQSFPIGVVLLTEKYHITHQLNKEILDETKNYLMELFAPLAQLEYGSSSISAIGGTPTSLYSIKNKLNVFDEKLIEGKYLSVSDLTELNEYLIQTSPEDLLGQFDKIVRGREDLLLSGSLILNTAVELLRCSDVRITTRGLRYGMICDYSTKIFGKYSVE